MDILHLAAPCRNVPVTFTLDLMDPIFASVAVSAIPAVAAGVLLGLCIAFARAEAEPSDHPVLAMLIARRDPLVGAAFAVAAWGLVLYGIPRTVLWLFDVDPNEALALVGCIQFCVVFVAMLVGERLWRFIA